MVNIPAPSPPYLGPPAHFSSGDNKPISRIVIHCTVSPCEPGGARDIAAYFRSPSSGGSAHYVVDPAEDVQAAYDSVICWHAPPNQHSLGFELCDPMKGPGERWNNPAHRNMLAQAARVVAKAALHYNVPMVRLDVADLRAGKRGICGHDEVSDAFHQSTHWDPGPDFPWANFMDMVRKEARQIVAAAQQERPDVQTPLEPTPQERAKEKARPSLVVQARRRLRHALARKDQGVHDRRAIRRALKELKGVK